MAVTMTDKTKKLMDNITNVISEFKVLYPTDYISVGGDWNMTPDEWVDRMPPGLRKMKRNDIGESFIIDNNLTDAWRSLNPGVKHNLWFKPNGGSKSRIDYWLVSDNFFTYVILELTVREIRNIGYGKFNSRMLQNKEYCIVRYTIMDNKNEDAIESNIGKWEFTKFKIR